jgi:hypothetical protein
MIRIIKGIGAFLGSTWGWIIMGVVGLFLFTISILGTAFSTAHFVVFGISIILIAVSLFVRVPGRFLAGLKQVGRRFLVIMIVFLFLILLQWLFFASASSSEGTNYRVPDGTTIRLPLLGSVVHYDSWEEIRVKGGFFVEEITVRYTSSPNPIKAISFGLFGDRVAVRVHTFGYGRVDVFDTVNGKKVDSKLEDHWIHSRLFFF